MVVRLETKIEVRDEGRRVPTTTPEVVLLEFMSWNRMPHKIRFPLTLLMSSYFHRDWNGRIKKISGSTLSTGRNMDLPSLQCVFTVLLRCVSPERCNGE